MVHLPSFLALGFAGAAIASPLTSIQQRQNTVLIVTSFEYSGEGCPQGSLQGSLGADGDFDVFYKNLKTSISPGQPKVKIRCQMKVGLQTTASKQLVIVSGTYKGHVRLTKGAWAKNQNQYKFADNPGEIDMEWPFTGPVNATTSFTNKLSTEFQSGCNSNGGQFTMIINNYLTMTTEGTGEGEISVSELDGAVEQSVKLTTKDCP
ncbi:putative secreted protein [Colletotrichum shisoi]|uniref:Putative secreted protein n=1 Tax=Colletotrichum shisoi TaxID=2078593 RepID=A0A5Q4C2S2_9PEZI|nr:putative secreted protein [Colletotrichum shisoi]